MANSEKFLEVKHLKTGYGHAVAVHDVSFSVEKGQIVALLGSNGAGKTSTLRALMGTLKTMSGEILLNGDSIANKPTHELAAMGLSMVPEGRHLFGNMSVEDNLIMGGYLNRDPKVNEETLQTVYKLFPRVQERSRQIARTLSGGEQQMVAIARGLMLKPKILILDEPSLGLMPKLVHEIFDFIQKINKEMGITIIIIEQNAMETLKFCDYAYIIQNGVTVLEGDGNTLLNDENVKKSYLGG